MTKIRPKTVDLRGLKLSPEEGFVLSRMEGATSVKELVALTGLEESRVTEIVGRLQAEGAVELEGAPIAPVPPAGAEQPDLIAEPSSDAESSGDAEMNAEALADAEEDAAYEAKTGREYRQLYETVYRPMSRDERVAAAATATGAHLLALCLDPEAPVIHAVFSNAHAGLDAARMAASHHSTAVGLENIAKRTDFLADALVQRRLLRNPQLPGTILQRLLNPKRMLDLYKVAVDREIPERSRVMTRESLRKKFMAASADERAALLFKTEGRCLVLLTNCALDSHATQILCGKTSFTILFIQNLARWSATPPMLLGHLLKMPVVRRNVGLQKMLLKHPNTPSEAKRRLGEG